MRLSSLSNTQILPVQLLAAALFALLLAAPASAEPGDHATAPGAGASEPLALAGPQEDDATASSQPEPVYPDGEPDIETVESDGADEAVEPSEPIVVATIDKGQQRMTVFVDGVETYNWPVSTGIGGYSTPSGEYTTSSMNKIWYSRQWDNAPMPHAVFFTKKGHAIHATNETKKLGKPASHGCVRLSPKNAETFFNLVKDKGLKNTQVVLTGVTPGGEYKVSQPQSRQRDQAYPAYPGQRGYDRYGYYDEAPPVRRKRRRLFQPYYQAPPQQPQQRQRGNNRRWFRAPGY
jgi:lipoprotein-anchoring transpeptidase ErfK/SrfK